MFVHKYYLENESLRQETTSSSTIVLPPVDAYSHQTIRLSIVSEKIMTWSVFSLPFDVINSSSFLFFLASNNCLSMKEDKQQQEIYDRCYRNYYWHSSNCISIFLNEIKNLVNTCQFLKKNLNFQISWNYF